MARDIAFFAVAFSTTKRGTELTHTLIQRILRLPNQSGLMFNFQWGKTQRDGADHIVITVPYEESEVSICPVRAVEQWVTVATCLCGLGHDEIIFVSENRSHGGFSDPYQGEARSHDAEYVS